MYRIGIDLGGTFIKTGITDRDYNILADSQMDTDLSAGPDVVTERMAAEVRRLAAETGIDWNGRIGVSSPGIIDRKTGTVIYSNNFGWEGYPLKARLEDLLNCRATVKNDAQCAVMGELKAGAAKGLKDVVMLTLGTGVGSGIAVDGRVFEGGGSGGIAGHMIIERNGRLCTCGRKGCLEAYASATALIAETKRCLGMHPDSLIARFCGNDPGNINGKTAFDAARAGDSYAAEIVDDYIDALANGIADLVNIFRPDVVLLGGGISNEGEGLLCPVNERVRKLCYGGDRVHVAEVRRAVLGSRAGLIGAAALTEGDY